MSRVETAGPFIFPLFGRIKRKTGMAYIADYGSNRNYKGRRYFGIKMEQFHKNWKKSDAKEKAEQIHGKKTQKFRHNGYTPRRRSKSNKLVEYVRIENTDRIR